MQIETRNLAFAIALAGLSLVVVTSVQAKPRDSSHGTHCTTGPSGKECVCSGVDACKNLKGTCNDADGDWTGGYPDDTGIPYGKCIFPRR